MVLCAGSHTILPGPGSRLKIITSQPWRSARSLTSVPIRPVPPAISSCLFISHTTTKGQDGYISVYKILIFPSPLLICSTQYAMACLSLIDVQEGNYTSHHFLCFTDGRTIFLQKRSRYFISGGNHPVTKRAGKPTSNLL